MRNNELPKNIINPFSDAFLDTWQVWKDYKWEEFKFKYKGCISEQTALMKLSELSGGKEDVAVEIIKQSISSGWKGLFELKNNSKNGQSGNQKGFTRESVNEEFASRNYDRRGS